MADNRVALVQGKRKKEKSVTMQNIMKRLGPSLFKITPISNPINYAKYMNSAYKVDFYVLQNAINGAMYDEQKNNETKAVSIYVPLPFFKEDSPYKSKNYKAIYGYTYTDKYTKVIEEQKSDYQRVIEKWTDTIQFPNFKSFKEFYEKCDEIMCTDWYKMDETGKCYGGFYEYPEDSFEKANAFTLSQRKNALELYKLPYPDHVLLETVHIGCETRHESVSFSDLVCKEVAKRYASEISHIKNIFPLTDLISDDMIDLIVDNYLAKLPSKVPLFPENWSEKDFIYHGFQY